MISHKTLGERLIMAIMIFHIVRFNFSFNLKRSIGLHLLENEKYPVFNLSLFTCEYGKAPISSDKQMSKLQESYDDRYGDAISTVKLSC